MSYYLLSVFPEKQEAIFVTFFKQGIKYEENKKERPNAVIGSGEGCRTCFQRNRIINCLKDVKK